MLDYFAANAVAALIAGTIVATTLRPRKRKNRCENCRYLKKKLPLGVADFRYQCEHPVPGRILPRMERFDCRPKYCGFYEQRKDKNKHE